MEFTGSELRIQALFRELRSSDEQLAPGFVAVWPRAQTDSLPPRLPVRLIYAGSFSALVLVVSLLLGSLTRERPPIVVGLPPPASVSNEPPTLKVAAPEVPIPKRVRSLLRRQSFFSQRNARLLKHREMISNAVAIATWQSPTTTLMSSPAEDVFFSLPQLTEAAVELRSFLLSAADKEDQ
jgi:hypothetical protein